MLKVTSLSKRFGRLEVLKAVSLEIAQGEVVALIGPSGTGKSTLLRCINFLERPDRGIVEIDHLAVNAETAKKQQIYALRQKTSMVFQHYHLILHRTILQNIADPLVIVRQLSQEEADGIAREALAQVGLSDKESAYPMQLSGGQQQRVGIARAVVLNPCVMLFDEPTSALDPELVGEILGIIRKLAQRRMTMLIVTHEMAFARDIADRVLFMDEGKILEQGTPEYLFEQCENQRVQQFLTRMRQR